MCAPVCVHARACVCVSVGQVRGEAVESRGLVSETPGMQRACSGAGPASSGDGRSQRSGQGWCWGPKAVAVLLGHRAEPGSQVGQWQAQWGAIPTLA